MNEILTLLYGMGGLVATAFYGPTVLKLLREPLAWQGQSLATWAGWISVATVSALYAIVVNGDMWFQIAASLNLASQALVLGIILTKRHGHIKAVHAPAANDDEDIGAPTRAAMAA